MNLAEEQFVTEVLGGPEVARERARLLLGERRRREFERERSRLENDLGAFFREAWKVLEPGRELSWSFHYELFAEYLGLVRAGKFKQLYPDVDGLIFNVPPRTAKSTFITVAFPVWCWTQDPTRRFMCASYSADLSTEHSLKRRTLIQSEWFQRYWGDRFALRGDQNLKTHFDNDKTGQMIATSVGGTATGKGGDVLIADDPLNPDEAASDVERKNGNDWLDNTLQTRRNDPSKDLVIVVMQRLHELDCTGHLLNQNPTGYVHVSIPLEAERDEEFVGPVSGRVWRRAKGEVLQATRFPVKTIASLKILRLVWAGQYQQRPAPLEGNMIKRSDVRYYGGIDPTTGAKDRELPDLRKSDCILTSTDAAFKELETSDYVANLAVAVFGPDRFILDLRINHLDLPGTVNEVLAMRTRTFATWSLVEDKANGSAAISALKKQIPGVIAVNPEGSKISRMFAVCGEWQSGNWYVDRNAAWTEPFIISITMFPGAAHDDDADAMTQAGVWIQNSMLQLGLVDYINQKRREQEGAMDQLKLAIATSGKIKPTIAESTTHCPECGSPAIVALGQTLRCNACAHQWFPDGRTIAKPTQRSEVDREGRRIREYSVGRPMGGAR